MEFIKKWKQGIKELTPLQHTRAKATGHLYSSIGLSIAWLGLLYRLITAFNLIQLGFCVFIICLIWLQINEYRSVKQRLKVMEKFQSETIESDILKKL